MPFEHGFSPPVGKGSEDARRAGDLAFRKPAPGPQWPGRKPSEQEREGVPSTDTQARSPLGVGTSTSGRAEELARRKGRLRRRTAGVKGPSRRPYGVAMPEDATGVARERERPVEADSPHLPPGDSR
jgi:hypothetical protein